MPRTNGAKKYSYDEVTILLNIVEKLQPIGTDMWKNVSNEFNKIARGNLWDERDEDSLKAKFKGLVSHKKPTGDPTCPSPVVRAKRIKRAIEEGVGATDLCDEVEVAEISEIPEMAEIARISGITASATSSFRSSTPTASEISANVTNSSFKSRTPPQRKISPFRNKRLKLDSKIHDIESLIFQHKHQDELKEVRLKNENELKEMKAKHENDLKDIKNDLRDFKTETRSALQQINSMIMMAVIQKQKE